MSLLSSILLIFVAFLLGGGLILFWTFWSRHKKEDPASSVLLLLQQQLDQLRVAMERSQQSINQQLSSHGEMMQNTHKTVGERLDNAARTVGELQNKLGKLDEANQKIYEVGKDISSLQEILKSPKLRGGLGELFLNDLLGQILPKEHFKTQYSFKDNEIVDAVILLGNYMVSVDSKFPLENFRRLVEAQEELDKKIHRKQFHTDVKKHIDSIAKKYIRPDEKTFDFALMYIPAENIYYEIIIKGDEVDAERTLSTYAMSKRVIPVSPNNFYVYLNTILLGLKGMKIEESISDVIASMSQLKTDLGRFQDDFELVGTHLNRAQGSFEKAGKRFDKIGVKLEALETPEVKTSLKVLS
jgi:DNA recombination protein RmuC